jgi:hypothetical protein
VEAVDEIRRRLDGARCAVLLGPPGVGKSLTAAAWLHGEAQRGRHARWASARGLREPVIYTRALHARSVVVDNLGFELGNARREHYLLAQRAAPAIEFFDEWIERRPRGQKLVVTTWMDFDGLSEAYNAGLARRVYEGAAVIEFGEGTRAA